LRERTNAGFDLLAFRRMRHEGNALDAQIRYCRDLVRDMLRKIQDDLFTVGAELGTTRAASRVPRIATGHVARIEAWVDRLDVGPLTEFLLPRGSEPLTRLHWARTVARRAERRVVTLSHHAPVSPEMLRYMNRLSALLYQMAIWTQKRERAKREHPMYRTRA